MPTLLAQSSGGTLGGLLVPALMVGAMYVLLIRPQRNRQRAQARLLEALAVGDEVMTAAGIFGRVSAIDADTGRVTVEVAPGVRLEMLRQAVRERIAPEVPEPESGS
ncbi:MAG: preprotein translocase subunit YajC [Actinomycetota bacterium]